MFKKAITIIFAVVLVLGITGCGNEPLNDSEAVNSYNEAIDLDFAKEVAQEISQFGDDPVMGMRSAGSPAELETAEYVEGVMNDIGLKNVTMDEITVDGWTFKGANITFTNAKGKEQKIDLGGYQTQLQAKNEEVKLVYLGEGTAADYEGVDVTDKLVLIDIDQNENWWISYPTVQAKLKGAKAVVAMSIFPEEGPDRVGVQDVCAPADAPALAISEQDSKALQKAIKESGEDEITVILNCDSTVTKDATSHNVWGEIPGKTDETIFVFGHIDGYFHSIYDDAQGVAVSMAIAKAMIDSGYEPDKTIRFCMHGSEEWGKSGNEYDWSTGAYEEIMTVHPEWKDGAFAIVNNDGGYSVEGETKAGVMSAVELKEFVSASVGELSESSKYEWSFDKNDVNTEDFQWTRMGIPSIVAGFGEGTKYDDAGYHSTYDSYEAQPLDEEGLREIILTYGKLAIDLDELAVRPMNFTARIEDFEDSLAAGADFDKVLKDAYQAAGDFDAKMQSIEEANAEADGEDENAKASAVAVNKESQEVYKVLQDYLVGLNFDPAAVIKHELYQNNIEALDATIEALEAGNVQEAYDEYLWAIDWAWYEMFFDPEVCEYMEKQLFENRKGTWGDGLIDYRQADIGEVVRALGEKYDAEKPDVAEEIEALKSIREEQQKYLEEIYKHEKEGLIKATELMKKYAK